MIKTRFAPSPTGELHIGGARTALFEYLFAKHAEGEFLLRIEDTDRERYVEGATERILESLEWLGIYPDNYHSVVVQSERKELYYKAALDLVKSGHAYVCDCSKDRLEKLRAEQEKQKMPPQYDRHCRDKDLKYKEGCVIRLKMPLNGTLVVHDLIRGDIEFNASLLDDPILLKSDGFPTYHLAVVVDDHDMGISHVIRAEEWLPSTPKHLLIYDAFGWKAPEFAHLPMILGSDKKKLSKRHGATSVLDYKKEGYLPDALVNFIALLGWNPKDEREEFSLEQLTREFVIENVNKSAAVFDIDKLNFINEKYIQKRDPGRLTNELGYFGMTDLTEGEVALAQRGGFKTLKEIAEYLKELRKSKEYESKMLVFRKSDKETTLKALEAARVKLASANVWSEEELQNSLVEVVSENNFTNGDVFWPIRVALSGEEKSPSPVELLVALDKIESLNRIDQALKALGNQE